jgi:general secretion pathway protein G
MATAGAEKSAPPPVPIRRPHATALAATKAESTHAAKRGHHRDEANKDMRRIIMEALGARPSGCAPQYFSPHQTMRIEPRLLPNSIRRAKGFTLIELMVVLVIIGVLAALIVPNVLDRADDARTAAAKTDIANLGQALKLYKLDNQRYPSSEQGLQALVTKPSAGTPPANWRPYLDKLPNDPWGRPYLYLQPGLKGEIDVMSLGADGQAGGEGKDADLGNW